jgi:hypothetical protein
MWRDPRVPPRKGVDGADVSLFSPGLAPVAVPRGVLRRASRNDLVTTSLPRGNSFAGFESLCLKSPAAGRASRRSGASEEDFAEFLGPEVVK